MKPRAVGLDLVRLISYKIKVWLPVIILTISCFGCGQKKWEMWVDPHGKDLADAPLSFKTVDEALDEVKRMREQGSRCIGSHNDSFGCRRTPIEGPYTELA